MRHAHLFCLPLLLVALHSLPAKEPSRSVVSWGHDFARSSCGACHAVGRNEVSRRSNAPPFPVIVNQEGLTADTLSVWLRGAHNYPGEMNFYLTDRQVDGLVAYMLTLKDPNFRRPPD